MRILYFLLTITLWLAPSHYAVATVLMGERTGLFEKATYTSPSGKASFDYYLLKPENYDPKMAYPLVLNLHGASGHSWGAYVLAEPTMRKTYPAFVLVPHAPMIAGWQVPVYEDSDPEPIVHIAKLIDKMESQYNIDKQRIYITGYSMGGFGTFGMVAKYPEMFAAAAPLCGGGELDDAFKQAGTPFLVVHGEKDPNIPVEQSRRMVAAIQKAGGKIAYTEYAGFGHNVWEEAYGNPKFWQWMFSQKREKPVAALKTETSIVDKWKSFKIFDRD